MEKGSRFRIEGGGFGFAGLGTGAEGFGVLGFRVSEFTFIIMRNYHRLYRKLRHRVV